MIKRAFFYTTRKRRKTLVLMLTLFVISTFVLTGLSILAAADQSALSLRQSVGGSIKLELDDGNSRNWTYQQGVGGVMVGYTGTPITDVDIEKVMSVKGVSNYMVAPDSIEVHVTVEQLLWVYLLGIVLCTAAVTLASIPIVKMKPKNILSQMS